MAWKRSPVRSRPGPPYFQINNLSGVIRKLSPERRRKNPRAGIPAKDAPSHQTAQVAAGSRWLWAREDMADSVDVIFVDEAGQMALANVLALSPAATSN